MKVEKAISILKELEENKAIQNFIAQGNSRYILYNVKEPVENFPNFTEDLDKRLMSIAYSYLSIGCSIFESGDKPKASLPLEKAALILEYVHSPVENRNEQSSYSLLTGALAYYASFQYSKAFILLRELEFDNQASRLISGLLKKKFNLLQKEINSVLLSSETIDENADELELNYKVYTKLIARSLAILLEYMISGEKEKLGESKDLLRDLQELASIDLDPLIWWLSRLMLIIIDGIETSSLWSTLPTRLDDETGLLDLYIRSLAFGTPNITELFVSQISALNKVLQVEGATVGLPTSSGKTRVAEIAILQNLIENPESLTLYLAPFRSLAFEVEESLSETFNPMGYHVSHLYGGAQFNKIDADLINDSKIIVATPEKAKAIIRADDSISSKIKLIVIDEGHLLGASQRYTSNEIFVEELKVHIQENDGKIILLSAVLPNTNEISKWITNSEDNVVESNWRPSSQRFGTLDWTGENVNISWESSEKPAPFNRSFIQQHEIKRTRSVVKFPSNKKEAIALTALKLTSLGSVLIFVGRKNMVKSQAKSVATAMDLSQDQDHSWKNPDDWELFELACEEALGEGSDIKNLASLGIICHDAGLPSEVRSTMEKLMRNGNPRIIISTSTLAQGVNIGVSSVIIANVYIGATPISKKDFWNIAGRAGRAFVDTEGKILYALDYTKEQWRIAKDKGLVKGYFDSTKMEDATSGLLSLITNIFDTAVKCDIDEELLLQLIAENDFARFTDSDDNDYSGEIANKLDWIDDTLLALNWKFESYAEENESEWVDDFFRNSLAYIQADKSRFHNSERVLSFFRHRNKGVIKMAGDSSNWKSYVSSGLPLKSSLIIEDNISDILEAYETFQASEGNVDDYVHFLKTTEQITSIFPSDHFRNEYMPEEIDEVRPLWFSGVPMTEIKERDNGLEICTDYFGFTLPWAINAIARKLYDLNYIDQGEAYSELAMLTELGLPNYKAAKLYLSGVKSRYSSTELSVKLSFGSNVKLWELSGYIANNFDSLISACSPLTVKWLEALKRSVAGEKTENIKRTNLRLDNSRTDTSKKLSLKEIDNRVFLCSYDYSFVKELKLSENVNMKKSQNNLGIEFEYDWFEEKWLMNVRNPRIRVEE